MLGALFPSLVLEISSHIAASCGQKKKKKERNKKKHTQKKEEEGKLLGGELIGPLAILEWVAIPFSRGSS